LTSIFLFENELISVCSFSSSTKIFSFVLPGRTFPAGEDKPPNNFLRRFAEDFWCCAATDNHRPQVVFEGIEQYRIIETLFGNTDDAAAYLLAILGMYYQGPADY
jgi:hypothetical protein